MPFRLHLKSYGNLVITMDIFKHSMQAFWLILDFLLSSLDSIIIFIGLALLFWEQFSAFQSSCIYSFISSGSKIGNWTKTTFDSSIIISLLSVKAINTGHKDDHLKRVPKIHTALWEPLKVSAIAVCPQSKNNIEQKVYKIFSTVWTGTRMTATQCLIVIHLPRG